VAILALIPVAVEAAATGQPAAEPQQTSAAGAESARQPNAASPGSTQQPSAASAGSARLVLTLEDAIGRALRNNELILIQREALASAESAITGAEGAYDPVLGFEIAWRRTTEPVNSAFASASDGQAALTSAATETAVGIRKLLGTGGQISLRSTASRGTTDAAFDLVSPAYGSTVGFELRQPLLRDRRVDAARLGLRVTAADRERAGAFVRREVIETVAAVERAYWTLIAARLAVDVREQAVGLAAAQLDETRIRIESGVAPETQIAEPQAELERRRGELLESQEAAARAENALKLLILGDDDADLWAQAIVPQEGAEVGIVPVDVTAAMEEALAARAELEAAETVVRRRSAETDFARDGTRPVLDLVLSYDRFGLAGSPNGAPIPGLPVPSVPGLDGGWWDSYETLFGGDFDDARIGFVFELPIGNRRARASAAIAASGERQARADLARARKAVRAEVLDAAATLQTAEARIQAARAARDAAEVQLSSEQERFAVGMSTNFLVLTRQNDLARARLDEIAALTDYRTARTELGRASGSLLEERGIHVQQR
jgi:HAE1 family hydrophobic/amphiphilic exporter-1